MNNNFNVVGRSGLRVSRLTLGCNNFGRPGTATYEQSGANETLRAALDHGIFSFDCADIYGESFGLSEEVLGRALVGISDPFVIGTKFGNNFGPNPSGVYQRASRPYVRDAVHGALKRLGVEHIDLMSVHSYPADGPVEEVLLALEELVVEGKINSYGCSNFSALQLHQANAFAETHGLRGFSIVQNELSLLHKHWATEVLRVCQDENVGFMAYFPLFSGLLTSKFARSNKDLEGTRIMRVRPHLLDTAPWEQLEQLDRIAAESGVTREVLALSWVMHQAGVVTTLVGSTSPQQVAANARALDYAISPDQLAEIDAIFDAVTVPFAGDGRLLSDVLLPMRVG